MSKVRRIGFGVAVAAALAVAYGAGRYHAQPHAGVNAGQHVLYYVDPMHPAYKSDKPGIAPDCGMQLEAVYAEDVKSAPEFSRTAELAPGAVSIDGSTRQLLGIRSAAVEKSGGNRVVHVVGRVVPEDTRVYRLNAGVDGYIRETSQDSVGTHVKKDQTLAKFYSPDFLATASGFLAATERVPGATGGDGSRTMAFPGALSKQGVSSLQGYTDRLRNLGMSEVQIKHIAEERQLPETIDIVAPVDGFILARNITTGQHFEHDMEFYRVADLVRVWVIAEVDEQEASYLRPGGTAQITLSDKGRPMTARISDSLPESQVGGGTVKIRLEVDNPKFELRPEMLVDVNMPVRMQAAVTVPVDALVDSGAHARVYVEKGEGIFEPREVKTGSRIGERVEILDGVQPGERVVAAATFLVDSESRLNTPAAKPASMPSGDKSAAAMSGASAKEKSVIDPSCGMVTDAEKATKTGNTVAYHGSTYYFCSAKCKEKFQSNPAEALKKHQGAVGD
jgi:Cu(I)/Ag(I) efflux system membrane fusion protein